MRLSPLQKLVISSAIFWPAMFGIALGIDHAILPKPVLFTIGALIGGAFGNYHSRLIREGWKAKGL